VVWLDSWATSLAAKVYAKKSRKVCSKCQHDRWDDHVLTHLLPATVTYNSWACVHATASISIQHFADLLTLWTVLFSASWYTQARAYRCSRDTCSETRFLIRKKHGCVATHASHRDFRAHVGTHESLARRHTQWEIAECGYGAFLHQRTHGEKR